MSQITAQQDNTLNILLEKITNLEALMVQNRFAGLTEESVDIWTVQDIADYLRFGYDYTYKQIIADPAFPAPIALPTRGKARVTTSRRYFSGAVIAYCRKKGIK